MSSDWRQNPSLVECFENCVAVFAGMPVVRANKRDAWIAEIKRRRTELGLTQVALTRVIGVKRAFVAEFERGANCGEPQYRRLCAALDRIEAERRA